MASTSTQSSKFQKMNKKTEEPSSVQRLLASLQQAQHRSGVEPSSEPSTSSAKPKKNNERKKKEEKKKQPKGPSVAARMQQQQQQAETARQQSKKNPRTRAVSEHAQPHYSQQGKGPKIPSDVLDELEFRFVSNMVDYELNDNIRICYNLELAHWYYIDHMVEGNYQNCPNLGGRDFTIQMYAHCKALKKYAPHADDLFLKFREYKSTVPTYGAILVDPSMEYVLLVQSYFSKGNNWGFPKGKINESEPPRDAAIRETYEETGFDFGAHSQKEKKFQRFINEAMVRLYLVKDVPMDFPFKPQTRKEIRNIRWFKLDDLPTDKNDEVPNYLKGNRFYMAMHFVRDIQVYVAREKEKLAKRAAASVPSPAPQSIFSQLFPNAGNVPSSSGFHEPSTPILKRLTSEELFSSFKKPESPGVHMDRPTLPDMSPAVDGMDSLAVLGLCTPLKPGASLNQFSAPPQNCPIICEEATSHMDLFTADHSNDMGFAMPTDLQQPVVTTGHPWQHMLSDAAPPQTLETHQGWLDTQLVNTIMQSPNAPIVTDASPATPTTVLGHLIGKPIQPQAILPQAATPTALGSAEKPKSSRISLSDNSAFKAINHSQKQSVPKATAPPAHDKIRSSSLTGHPDPVNRSQRSLFNSIASPISSGLPSVQGDDGQYEEVWLREQLAATAGTSISSLAASNQELAMYNRDTPVENRNTFRNEPHFVPMCQQWTHQIRFDKEYIVGPTEFWAQKFSTKTAATNL